MGTDKAFIARMFCGHVRAISWDDARRPSEAIPRLIRVMAQDGGTIRPEDAVPPLDEWIDDDCRNGRCARPLARQPASE